LRSILRSKIKGVGVKIKSVDAEDSFQYPLEGYAENGKKGRREKPKK